MLTKLQKRHLNYRTLKYSFNELPKTNIIEVYRHLINNKIRISGQTAMVNCIFHNETKNSLVLYPKTQSYYCFGCGATGTAFKLIMEIENCTFKESLEIARRYQ